MLKFSPLLPTGEGDYAYTVKLRMLSTSNELGLSMLEKVFQTRLPDTRMADKMACVEWSWYVRGNCTTYINRCVEIWDNLTIGGAPVMAKPRMTDTIDILKRFSNFLYSDQCQYCIEVCRYYTKMLPQLQSLLPPDSHPWHAMLREALDDMTEAVAAMQKDIDGIESIIDVETKKATA